MLSIVGQVRQKVNLFFLIRCGYKVQKKSLVFILLHILIVEKHIFIFFFSSFHSFCVKFILLPRILIGELIARIVHKI